ncbi:uncharacterized protein LOC111001630 [Pieris rapae]|uniref:uncharacterized protein LOC111001630 n=1 Tax=Pieris rapae TaxID=64459 RepID=UPI001E27B8C2|nr:uncharacterized protein LOC111001630 [Pieris rapae]
MFYHYFRFFNYISTFFGQRKPFEIRPSSSIGILSKFWSLIIAVSIIYSSILTIDFTVSLHIKKNDETGNINEFIVCLIIFLTNLRREDLNKRLYAVINSVVSGLKLTNKSVKLLTIKLYVWITCISAIYIIAIVKEILDYDPPFILLLRIPLYLTLLHFYTHLCLILSLLKLINIFICDIFRLNSEDSFLVEGFSEPNNLVTYLISYDIRFIKVKHRNFDLKHLCKMYDHLSTCVQYLQKIHSLQMILTTWLMFSSAVSAVALISTEKTDTPLLKAVNGLLPFFWFGIGCFIDDQIRQEVERTDLIIIKLLIEFRCEPATKEVLGVFKQAISTNSLQFKAGNMYKLNYAAMLGTLVSVITYSIIVIQLF